MKEFRGSIIAIVLLCFVVGYYVFQVDEGPIENVQQVSLFRFEKHEVNKVTIKKPTGEIIELKETEGEWIITERNWRANPSMINRIKHQLHDLDARTLVTNSAKNPTLYGLGKNAIQVQLDLTNGKSIRFLVGDPNPSSVSYYIQPLPGESVYTVKKSSMDYFSQDLNAFRNPRFAQFDIKDAMDVFIRSNEKEIHIKKNGQGQWYSSKEGIDIDRGEMRTILSKVAALKAVRFIDSVDGILDYGLNNPRLTVHVSLPNAEIEVVLGSSFSEGRETLSYIQKLGDPTIYVVRVSFDDLMDLDVYSLRNRRFTKVESKDILSIESTPTDNTSNTVALIEKKADLWNWEDGSLISGSTPERLASALADIRALSFVEDSIPKEEAYKIIFRTKEREQILHIGGVISERTDDEGIIIKSYHAWNENGAYSIDGHILRVLGDLNREYRRKLEEDSKTESMHNRIEKKEE